MKKSFSRQTTPKAQTCSMYFKNKKTIKKTKAEIEGETPFPLCSERVRYSVNTFNTQAQKNQKLWNTINVKDIDNIIRPKQRKASALLNVSLYNQNFGFNNLFNKDNNEFGQNDINLYDDDKINIINLTNEKINLNNNNITLLQMLNDINQKNAELKSYIEENKKKRLLTKAKFLGLLEKIKHRSKEINYNTEVMIKKNINNQNINEIKKENEYLIQKIKMKNNDFQNLYDFMMDIISYSEPYIKECQDNVIELNLFKNKKLKEQDISYDKHMSKEITKMKNDYEKLKIKYNELVEKLKNEDYKEEPQKKVKFVMKNISDKTTKDYEDKIKKIKEENTKIKDDYKIQIEELKKELSDIELKGTNKDKEYELLNDKYQKLIVSLKEKLNIKKVDINDEFFS